MRHIEENKTAQILTYIKQYQEVYIYGAGKVARKTLKILKKIGVDIKAFIVTEMVGNEKEIMDIPVRELVEVENEKNQLFIIGVSEQYEKEVEEYLKKNNKENILKIEEKSEKWKKNRGIPKLEITAKIGCCIQCKYCPQELFYTNYFKEDINRTREMTLEQYKVAIDHMPKETIITFAGFVEPFLHPQGIEMILYAHNQGHPIELYTTLVGLTEDQFERIKDIPFLEVVLHTPDKDNFANIPITEEYIKVLDKALDCKKPNGEDFIDSANCQSEPAKEFLEIAKGRVTVESRLVDRAGNLSDSSLRKSQEKKGAIVCNRSFNQNHWVLLPDGTVVLCCMDFGMKHVLGNLLEADYQGIIDSCAYKAIRTSMSGKNEDIELLCRKCTSSSCVDKKYR